MSRRLSLSLSLSQEQNPPHCARFRRRSTTMLRQMLLRTTLPRMAAGAAIAAPAAYELHSQLHGLLALVEQCLQPNVQGCRERCRRSREPGGPTLSAFATRTRITGLKETAHSVPPQRSAPFLLARLATLRRHELLQAKHDAGPTRRSCVTAASTGRRAENESSRPCNRSGVV